MRVDTRTDGVAQLRIIAPVGERLAHTRLPVDRKRPIGERPAARGMLASRAIGFARGHRFRHRNAANQETALEAAQGQRQLAIRGFGRPRRTTHRIEPPQGRPRNKVDLQAGAAGILIGKQDDVLVLIELPAIAADRALCQMTQRRHQPGLQRLCKRPGLRRQVLCTGRDQARNALPHFTVALLRVEKAGLARRQFTAEHDRHPRGGKPRERIQRLLFDHRRIGEQYCPVAAA